MSNSNGMYNVLNIFKKLEPVKQPAQQVTKTYEKVEAKGSILEGVGRVEKKLAEQFADFKEERETLKTKTGTIYKGGKYGTEYQGDAADDVNPDAPKKRGRPAKGTPKKVKPAGEKRGRGRPKAEKPMDAKSAPKGDIFGRTTGSVPKGKKGTVVKGKDTVDERAVNPYAVGMAQAMKSTGDKPPLKKSTITKAHDIAKKVKTNESQLTEGVNFAEMMRETEMSVGEMLETIQNDIKVFKETGMCSDTLEAFLKIHNHGKKQLQDATLPRGPSFAPQHAEIPPVQKPSMLDRAKGMVKTGLEKLGHGDDEAMKANLRQKMGVEEELNELARLAGIANEGNDGNVANNAKPYDKVTRGDVVAGRLGKDEMGGKEETEEGNEFSGALDAARDAGKKEFKVDGKTYPVKEDVQLDECGEMSPMGSMAGAMEQQQGKISVSTNMSSDGNKNVSINADGEAANQLMQMLKMAGLGGGEAHTKLAIAVPADSGEGEAEVAEAEGQYANTPDEEYEGVDAIVDQGEDMNRQKKQFADKPRQGDNPMATMEEVDPIGSLGRDLMKEYQALKLAK